MNPLGTRACGRATEHAHGEPVGGQVVDASTRP